jgi:hypothetical protein
MTFEDPTSAVPGTARESGAGLEAPPTPEVAEAIMWVDDPNVITKEEEEELVEAEPEALPVNYSGQDFDVAGLVRRLNSEDVLIPTFGHADDRIESAGFQRSFVWHRPQMDRFIESLLLGYPIVETAVGMRDLGEPR